jgi:amino acid transporter
MARRYRSSGGSEAVAGATQLTRSLRLTQLFTLGFGMVVGVGWMLLVGQWLTQAGPLGAVFAFVAGAILIGLVGLCYAEIATVHPEAGGEVVYARRVLGHTAAFGIGWLLALMYVVVAAFEAIGFAWLLSVVAPGLAGPVAYRFLGQEVTAGALAVGVLGMALFCWINIRGAAMAARVQDLLIYAKIAISLGFVAVGLLRGSQANLHPLFVSPPDHPLAGFMAVFVTAPFWYAGFGVIPQALGERAEGLSVRRAGLSILAVLAAACLFYCLIIVSVAAAAPRAVLDGATLPAAAAFEAAFGSPLLRNVVVLAGMLGLLTTWNGLFFSAGRVLYAMGEDGLLPGLFARLDPRWGTPASALIFVAGAATACVFAGRGAVTPIVNLSGLIFAIVYLTVAVAVLLRRLQGAPPAQFRVPGGIPTIGLAAVVAFGMCVAAAFEIAKAASGGLPPEFAVLGGWLVAGAAIFLLQRRAAPAARGGGRATKRLA